jgi:hypothetical protein
MAGAAPEHARRPGVVLGPGIQLVLMPRLVFHLALPQAGMVLDVPVQARRDRRAAKRMPRKLLRLPLVRWSRRSMPDLEP